MNTGLKQIECWQREGSSSDPDRALHAIRLRGLYESLANQLYHQYEPTKAFSNRISRDFLTRVEDWLSCFKHDQDRWAAFRSIEYLFFAGQYEFEEIYRYTVENIIIRWLVEITSLDIFSPKANQQIRKELKACWPCPVTDSLRINGFLHVTGFAGKGLRPDWMSLSALGDPKKIDAYKNKNCIKYLVLLEDFVGAGGQICRALKFAATAFSGPILVVPLIVCAPGDQAIKNVIGTLGRSNIDYRPAVVLDDTCLVRSTPVDGEPRLFKQLRHTMKEGYDIMQKSLDGAEYGWKGVGSLVVMYSNCPNNTPPIFHYASARWKPLFPRSARS